MDVPPHPHTGLQTAGWLFQGEIEHRDSGGVHQLVRPGALNLMTAGADICHSEVSTAATTVLHGVQLWVALPDAARHGPREFEHHVPDPFSRGGSTLRVFLGELAGKRSPVHTFTPLLGAQLDLATGSRVGGWRPATSPTSVRARHRCGCTTRPSTRPGSCCSAAPRSARTC